MSKSEAHDPYVKLARAAVEEYVRNKKVIGEEVADPVLFEERGAVFVSIKKRGALRGCIGTIHPRKRNVAQEIIENAISAATCDPRFPPISADELGELEYSVDVLSEPEPVRDTRELDPKKYGVIVKSGYKTGVLLPDLEGVNTVEEQLAIALRKAGISPQEDYEILRFQVKRHK